MTNDTKKIRAQLNYYRRSPRKVRLVADMIRGMNIEEAFKVLRFALKGSSQAVAKLLKSASASAKNDHKIAETGGLFIKEIIVNEGPTLKRYRPRARGSASPIRKRTSHVMVVLEERPETKNYKLKAASQA